MVQGPVQLIVVAFAADSADDVRRQVAGLHGRGLVWLIDQVWVDRGEDGRLVLPPAEPEVQGGASGAPLRRLLAAELPLTREPDAERRDGAIYGITAAEARSALAAIPAGSGAALLLLAHPWLLRLRGGLGRKGGRVLAHGFLASDAVRLVAPELDACFRTEASALREDARRGAAILDALAFLTDVAAASRAALREAGVAPADSTAPATIAAEALRTLIVAGLVDELDAEPALAALADAGLVGPAVVDEALEAAAAAWAQAENLAARRPRPAAPAPAPRARPGVPPPTGSERSEAGSG